MNNGKLNLAAIVSLVLSLACSSFAYEGYTPLTTGGEGGNTIWVSNLNNSGSGSFRAALSGLDGSPTIIKFSVGGTINVSSSLSLTSPNVTIAGETAPAPGITVNGGGATRTFEINTHDVIVRHIRFRNASVEGIQVWGDYNIIIDHCTITGSGDGALDINGGTHHLVASYCLFADNVEVHRSYGKYTSLHHNLYTYNNRRQPKIFKAGPCYDFRNNVVEYWTNTGTNVSYSTAGVNIINNYYGPPAPGEAWGDGFYYGESSNFYTNGNYNPGENVDAIGDRETPVPEPNVITTYTADASLLSFVRGNCGAMPRDATDESWAGTSSGYLQADAGSDQTEVVDVDVTFDGSGSTGNIVSYSWDYDDGSADGSGVSPSHSYDDVNVYTVTLTVTDDTNDTDQDTCVITIVDPNALTADAGADQDVDVGDTVNFDGSGSTGNITLYEWDFGDGDSNTGETTNHVYDTAGQFTVTLTVTDDTNDTDQDTCLVTVDPNITISYAAGDTNGWDFDEDGVVLQTIYGTAQDANGDITANSYQYR